MELLLAFLTLLLQPVVALIAVVSVLLAVAFGVLVPGATATQAIILGCIGMATATLFAGEAKRPAAGGSQASTPSYLVVMLVALLSAIWGASSSATAHSFLVGAAVQAIASLLWLQRAAKAKFVASQGHAVLATVVAVLAFLVGALAAGVAA